MARIFLLDGHPAETSISRQITQSYASAAQAAGHEVRHTHLRDLEFDSDFGFGGYRQTKPLEPDLEKVLQDLDWADHVVMATPIWWGGVPAKLKGLFDRVLLPGKTFDPRNSSFGGLPAPLLTGRSARIFITSDTPGWYLRLVYRNALLWQLRGQIFGFVGLKPTRITHFTGASHPKSGRVEAWLKRVRKLGAAAA